MMFYGFVILLVSVVHVESNHDFTRLEEKLDFLQNQVDKLNKQVSHQANEIDKLQSELREKNVELEHYKDGIKKNLQNKAFDRRFLLGNTTENVAFFARIDAQEMTGINQQQTILFDKVVLNEGNYFDQTSGQFLVPASGFYLLSVAVASDLGHSHEIEVALMKNDVILARAHAHGDSGHVDQAGITVVDELNAEDKVYVRSLSDNGTALYGLGLTTFSGVHIMFK